MAPEEVLLRSPLRLVMVKAPAPVVVSSTPSARAAASTVAVLPLAWETEAAALPVVTLSESVATTLMALVPASTIVSLASNVPLLTVKLLAAALLVTVVDTLSAPSSSRLTEMAPVAALVRLAVSPLTVKLPVPERVRVWSSAMAPALTVARAVLVDWTTRELAPVVTVIG